jgi:hypothetical protein
MNCSGRLVEGQSCINNSSETCIKSLFLHQRYQFIIEGYRYTFLHQNEQRFFV